eukprot:05103.XXX_283137_283955_1 [CDS] Oithona nana genome sequencing.
MFGKLFCKKKDDKALVQKLRETEEVLKKKRQSLGKRIDAELATIRENVKTNKPVALDALKRKKRLSNQIHQIDGTLKTTKQQRDALQAIDPDKKNKKKEKQPKNVHMTNMKAHMAKK